MESKSQGFHHARYFYYSQWNHFLSIATNVPSNMQLRFNLSMSELFLSLSLRQFNCLLAQQHSLVIEILNLNFTSVYLRKRPEFPTLLHLNILVNELCWPSTSYFLDSYLWLLYWNCRQTLHVNWSISIPPLLNEVLSALLLSILFHITTIVIQPL